MKTRILALGLLAALSLAAQVPPPAPAADPVPAAPVPALANNYEVVGHIDNSPDAYYGVVAVVAKEGFPGQYAVLREVEGKRLEGTGQITVNPADNSQALVTAFQDGRGEITVTYLLSAGPGGTLRLTGVISETHDTRVTSTGIEALFPARK